MKAIVISKNGGPEVLEYTETEKPKVGAGQLLVRVQAAGVNYIATREDLLRRANDVLAGIKEGWLKLTIEHRFKLAEAAAAHKLLESRQSSGKIVLLVE